MTRGERSSPGSPFKAACIQINAQADMDANLAVIEDFITQAASQGAELIVTPENMAFMARDPRRICRAAFKEREHPAVLLFQDLAVKTNSWLLAGSLGICLASEDDTPLTDSDLPVNRSLLFNPQGKIVARYDKIHLFDVDLGGGESYQESMNYHPGDRAVMASTPWGKIGLSICYDLRFAYLYRALARAGAFLFTVPAAFTRATGQAHWECLLRARAIECGGYVLAPAQCGEHDGGRRTYGHSMMIDPWGNIVAQAAEEPGYILCDIDPHHCVESRNKLPSLSHDRSFCPPS